jgi:hypothetical protein
MVSIEAAVIVIRVYDDAGNVMAIHDQSLECFRAAAEISLSTLSA